MVWIQPDISCCKQDFLVVWFRQQKKSSLSVIMLRYNRMFCCIFWWFFLQVKWCQNMKKLFCCPALELFIWLPLWKTVRLSTWKKAKKCNKDIYHKLCSQSIEKNEAFICFYPESFGKIIWRLISSLIWWLCIQSNTYSNWLDFAWEILLLCR